MTTTSTADATVENTDRRIRPALLTMFLGSFTLVTAEFLPPGVLTALATDLHVPEGVVGLSVSATALTALLAALGLGALFPRLDRRTLLIGLTIGAAVSNVVVALAPNIVLLLIARLLLGLAVGGYWSMALVIAAELVPAERLGKAMMIVNAGTTVATVAGVPLGVLLSTYAGWRTTFLIAAALTAATAVAVRLMLPPIAPSKGIGFGALGSALRAPGVTLGLVSMVAVVAGHFAGYTYIRPALAELLGAGPAVIPILLALFGIGGLLGNFVLGALADRHLGALLLVVPTAIGLSLLAIIASATFAPLAYLAVVVWGVAFGGILNLVQVWVSRVLPDRLEAGSGLVVGGFQLAIILGSAVGGRGVDSIGLAATYAFGAVAAVLGGVLIRRSLTLAAH
ncbi:MFS transporter [Nocardia alba]|uniref:Putative MFS family arabinose efflux permease n=1 Tax=Nocardia alba TaxID=225051 RepID=A0A4R1GAG0_9NOCA|nr:MFS transporter [Nocardia alba]TCK01172.1 putative MFS family arabinose efflux permease [Nocardia alba]